jgi:hypothetical protein
MFGTLHIPTGRPWRYGLPGPQPHWAEELFYPLVRMPEGVQESRDDAVAGDAPART